MKRDIKFRYIHQNDETGIIVTNIWGLDELERSDPQEFETPRYSLVARNQFTGLTDKNGKEIYEGDILRAPANMSYRFKDEGKVQFIEDYGGFAVVAEWSKNQHHELLTCDVAIGITMRLN